MFRVVFSNNSDSVYHLKVCGIRNKNIAVVWEGAIEYMLAKYFVDNLNEHRLPEEELVDATIAFLMELHGLNKTTL